MGVDIELFERLVEPSTRFCPGGRTLMLGRHGFDVGDRVRHKSEKVLPRGEVDTPVAELEQEDEHCKSLMRGPGSGEMAAPDFPNYEGEQIIHDPKKAVPPEFEQQFDFIFDGGTIEHVFTVPVALESVHRTPAVEERSVSANGFDGWRGHGIYQFNPELVWPFWADEPGCVVHDRRGIHKRPRGRDCPAPFPDPAETGKRLRMKGKVPPGRICLYYKVERASDRMPEGRVLQSDYETRWHTHGNADKTRLDEEGVV